MTLNIPFQFLGLQRAGTTPFTGPQRVMSTPTAPGDNPIPVHYNLNPTLRLMDDFKIKVP